MARAKVLVTGVAGFIGSHVAEHCLRAGCDVVGVDDLSGGFRRSVPPGVRFTVGDLRDPAVIEKLWRDEGSFEVVYHLAAYAAEGLSHQVRRYNYQTNLVPTVALLNAAINGGTRHFVFTSSIAVYGTGQLPLREDSVPRPEDPYGIAKYACELDIEAAAKTYGIGFTIFRPHNVYGERQNLADPHRNVIAIFLRQGLSGEPMSVFGDGHQTRAFTHVDDVAPLIARSPWVEGARNRTFNVGSDDAVRVIDLAREVSGALGIPVNVRHLPARPEVMHAVSDHALAREVFGVHSTLALTEGLRGMAAWARALEMAPRKPFEGLEIGRPPGGTHG
jgi:UDP-glucose 4-epimerase